MEERQNQEHSTQTGLFPLFVASAKGKQVLILIIRIEEVKRLLGIPETDINQKDNCGINSFWIAAFNNQVEVLKILKEHGIEMNTKNQNGSNALHIAVKRNNLQVVQELIKMQFPLDLGKNNGITAAGIAAHRGYLEILKELAKAGANLKQCAPNGVSPLYLAIKSNQLSVIAFLLDQDVPVHLSDPSKANFSPIFFAIKQENFKALDLLCDKKFDLDSCTNPSGYTPLTLAASMETPTASEIANYLSLRVKNLDQQDPQNFTPLARFIFGGQFDVARKFLQRGANINYVNREGKTIFVMAVQMKNVQAVKFLIEQGADPHIEDNSGQDACDYAKANQEFKSITQLNTCSKELRKSTIPEKFSLRRKDVLAQAYKNAQKKISEYDFDEYSLSQSFKKNELQQLESTNRTIEVDMNSTQQQSKDEQKLSLKEKLDLDLLKSKQKIKLDDPDHLQKYLKENPQQLQKQFELDKGFIDADNNQQLEKQLNPYLLLNVENEIQMKSFKNQELKKRRYDEIRNNERKRMDIKESVLKDIRHLEYSVGKPQEVDTVSRKRQEIDWFLQSKISEQEANLQKIRDNRNTLQSKILSTRQKGQFSSEAKYPRMGFGGTNDYSGQQSFFEASRVDRSPLLHSNTSFENLVVTDSVVQPQHDLKLSYVLNSHKRNVKQKLERSFSESSFNKKLEKMRDKQAEDFVKIKFKTGDKIDQIRARIQEELLKEGKEQEQEQKKDKNEHRKSLVEKELRSFHLQILKDNMNKKRNYESRSQLQSSLYQQTINQDKYDNQPSISIPSRTIDREQFQLSGKYFVKGVNDQPKLITFPKIQFHRAKLFEDKQSQSNQPSLFFQNPLLQRTNHEYIDQGMVRLPPNLRKYYKNSDPNQNQNEKEKDSFTIRNFSFEAGSGGSSLRKNFGQQDQINQTYELVSKIFEKITDYDNVHSERNKKGSLTNDNSSKELNITSPQKYYHHYSVRKPIIGNGDKGVVLHSDLRARDRIIEKEIQESGGSSPNSPYQQKRSKSLNKTQLNQTRRKWR